jgi:uncharacterized membrane protein YgcG
MGGAIFALVVVLALPVWAGQTAAPAASESTITFTIVATATAPAAAAATTPAGSQTAPHSTGSPAPAPAGTTLTLTMNPAPSPTPTAVCPARTLTVSMKAGELEDILHSLRGQLKGFTFQRSGTTVTMAGSAAELAVAETVLRQAGHMAGLDFSLYPVRDKDPDSVDKVIAFILQQVLPNAGRGPLALLHDGSNLLVWGSREDRDWAWSKVGELATSKSDTDMQFALVSATGDEDPTALDGIKTIVEQAAPTSSPDRTPLNILREGEAFWIYGSKANCDWAQIQITTLLKKTPRLSFVSLDVSDRSVASVDMVVELVRKMALATGRTSLTVQHHENRLLLWGSEDDCAWAKRQMGDLAEPNHLQQTDIYWLRGTVDPEEVRNYLGRGRWPVNSWAINGRRIEVTREQPARQEILQALWERRYLYTRAFKSLSFYGLLPNDVEKVSKLPEIPDRDWRWDVPNNRLLVTARPEDSVLDYSHMIYDDHLKHMQGEEKRAWDLVINYPSDDIDDNDCPLPEAQTVRLYFARDPWRVVGLLNGAASSCGAADVVASADLAAGALPGIVLVGPRLQIRNLKRVLEQIDVQHPGVQLEVWACQLSGSDAGAVSQRAREAQQRVECTARLVRGYVHVLTQYATHLEKTNRDNLSRMYIGQGGADTDAFAFLSPSAAHLPSLTEMLLAQMLVVPAEVTAGPPNGNQPARAVSAVRWQLGQDLQARFSAWLTGLRLSDPEALQAWTEILPVPSGAGPTDRAGMVGSLLQAASAPKSQPLPADQLDALLPQRFLAMLNTEEDAANIQTVLSRYLISRNAEGPDPDQTIALRADAQALLQGAEQCLADDIREIFLNPLEENLRQIIGADNRYGMGSVSKTSVSVISESEATVTGAASTYFQGVPPQQSVSDTLTKAAGNLTALTGGGGGGGAGGGSGGGSGAGAGGGSGGGASSSPVINVYNTPPPSTTSTSTSTATAQSAPTGTTATGTTGAGAPSTHGAAGGLGGLLGGAAGMPTAGAVALGLAIADQPRVWASMEEGTALSFTPHVLQGGSGAELNIDFDVKHEAPTDLATGGKGAEEPLDRVAEHHAVTTVYLQPLDLFSLSSFAMETSTGRRTGYVPILGNIPLIGQLFRYSVAADHIHHESLLVVYSTVLPTANDWQGRLEVTSMTGTGTNGATWYNWEDGLWAPVK